jgi:hypothetical protein
VEQFLAGGAVRSRGAHGDQDGGGVEDQFPLGRGNLAASGTQRTGSHHKLAPHSEIARSKQSDGSGTAPASASMSGNDQHRANGAPEGSVGYIVEVCDDAYKVEVTETLFLGAVPDADLDLISGHGPVS